VAHAGSLTARILKPALLGQHHLQVPGEGERNLVVGVVDRRARIEASKRQRPQEWRIALEGLRA
jgi:hypothetical protein